MKGQFDIVIPIGPHDAMQVDRQIEYAKRNILGYRNIYIIPQKPGIEVTDCITVQENVFPFGIVDVEKRHGKSERNGWYLQQLIKLYGGFVVKNILDRYLVIDADTYFLKPTTFIENGKSLYNSGKEHHAPYFKHMKELHPTLEKIRADQSGICHHMMFEKKYVRRLFQLVEEIHKREFWKVYLESVSPSEVNGSGASEYEIYFNYMLNYHPEEITIRRLKWRNVSSLEDRNECTYISYHWYMRRQPIAR